MRPGQLDHSGVELGHRHVLDRRVLEELLDHPAIATTDDEHVPDGPVRQDRHVAEHLVVDVLVGRRQLRDAVEHDELAEADALGDHEALMGRLTVEEHPADLDRRPEARMQGLRVPGILVLRAVVGRIGVGSGFGSGMASQSMDSILGPWLRPRRPMPPTSVRRPPAERADVACDARREPGRLGRGRRALRGLAAPRRSSSSGAAARTCSRAEVELIGDLHGRCRRAIHLQCAGGRDTLSLWNLGRRRGRRGRLQPADARARRAA